MNTLDPTLVELFREEVGTQTSALSTGLVDLESAPADGRRIEPLMRAAHSLKGAARIVNVEPAVHLAHVMEDLLVAAQAGQVRLTPGDIDLLLAATDLLAGLGTSSLADWSKASAVAVETLIPRLKAVGTGVSSPTVRARAATVPPREGRSLPEAPAVELGSLPLVVVPTAGQTMLDLFREQLRETLAALLPICETGADSADAEAVLESLRLLRSSALLIKCQPIADAADGLADWVTGWRADPAALTPTATGWLRYVLSLLVPLVSCDEVSFTGWRETSAEPLREAVGSLSAKIAPISVPPATSTQPEKMTPHPAVEVIADPVGPTSESTAPAVVEAAVRVSAGSLSRMMGLAGEALVQSRWLQPFSSGLIASRKSVDRLIGLLDGLAFAVERDQSQGLVGQKLNEIRRHAAKCRQDLADQAAEFDAHAARTEDLHTQLYREVIASRMRPFSDGVGGLPRMVRDMARSLGKQARLVVEGGTTEVDRDVLEQLEAPLGHLIRNAVDHGIEPGADRVRAGKPEVGVILLRAYHQAGMLFVRVTDDGPGIDLDRLRTTIVDRGLSTPDVVRRMGEAELLEFLFLPGFSTTTAVTEFSGRGVGLDVVSEAVRRIGGSARVSTEPGRGTTFLLQLPVTLSVIRAVIVRIAGEAYAFPHTRIDRLMRIPVTEVRSLEHRQFVTVDGRTVGLVHAAQVLELPVTPPSGLSLSVVLLGDASGVYGLIVDEVVGEQDLVVRPLDPRLGKVPDISAAAILDDGEPVLVVDVEDTIRSMDRFIQTGVLLRTRTQPTGPERKKRVLVVDDSITVREVERQLLAHRGYEVSVAVDGVDGWNRARQERFDLIVTDVDMPRMTGLQLVQAVRADPVMKDLPVVIVSYKEREEDRLRGLEVGANAYLTKSSFHDNRFVQTVEDLIGAG